MNKQERNYYYLMLIILGINIPGFIGIQFTGTLSIILLATSNILDILFFGLIIFASYIYPKIDKKKVRK